MKMNIDLGRKISEPSSCCAPAKEDKDRVYYPTVYAETKKPLDLPKEGTMVIRFKKVGYSERNEHHTCEFEVHEIVSVEGDADVESPSKRDKSSEEALDTLAKALKKEKGY